MLVIWKDNTYEVFAEIDDSYILKPPFRDGKKYLVSKLETTPYVRTYNVIRNRWFENSDGDELDIMRYLLEIHDLLLSPKFLTTPKEPGVYACIWLMDDNRMKMSYVWYNPGDERLSNSDQLEGYDTFVMTDMKWTQIRHFISGFRYLRFIPFNFGITYLYLMHLIEADLFTKEEVAEIYGRR